MLWLKRHIFGFYLPTVLVKKGGFFPLGGANPVPPSPLTHTANAKHASTHLTHPKTQTLVNSVSFLARASQPQTLQQISSTIPTLYGERSLSPEQTCFALKELLQGTQVYYVSRVRAQGSQLHPGSPTWWVTLASSNDLLQR